MTEHKVYTWRKRNSVAETLTGLHLGTSRGTAGVPGSPIGRSASRRSIRPDSVVQGAGAGACEIARLAQGMPCLILRITEDRGVNRAEAARRAGMSRNTADRTVSARIE